MGDDRSRESSSGSAAGDWQRVLEEEKKAIEERRLKKEATVAEIERQKRLREQRNKG